MTNNSAVVFKSKYLSAYSEYDIQTACNIATGDDETTGKEVIKILKIITKKGDYDIQAAKEKIENQCLTE